MQTHLKGFGLENFRVFKDYTWFDFAPITILTGPNSSGKSSLNKALLLLKDNFEKGNLPPYYTLTHEGEATTHELLWTRDTAPSEEEGFIQVLEPSSLDFDGRTHGLNDPSKTLNNKSNSSTFSLTISHTIYVIRPMTGEYILSMADDLSTKVPDFYDINNKIAQDNIEVRKIIELLRNNEELRNRLKSDEKVTKHRVPYQLWYRLEFIVENSEAKTLYKLHILNENNTSILSITDHEVYFDPVAYNNIVQSDDFNVLDLLPDDFENRIESTYEISLDTWLEENGLVEVEDISKKIYSSLGIEQERQSLTLKAIGEIFKKTDYLAPSHNRQKRVYSEDDISEFKKTMHHLYQAQASGFNFENFFKACSAIFNINGFFTFEYDKEKDTYFPNISGNALTEFGYGYNQLASLMFKIASHGAKKYIRTYEGYTFMGESSMLIVEEPEANLHPKFQSLLADFLVEASDTFYIQFIVETHSEYLIRKLQYLTATKKVKPKDSIIYYFHEPNNVPVGQKQVKKIEIMEDGSLSDEFGTGFFDEATNWKFELLRLKNTRKN